MRTFSPPGGSLDELGAHASGYRADSTRYKYIRIGTIFGIKKTSEDQLQTTRIIEQKCAAESKRDFEFYQAHYSNRTKKIELAPLTLLKVN